MSQKYQPVRGTHDILPDEFEKFQAVVSHARRMAMLDGFREMTTPIFETTDVFARSMGETSDVVSKEMFTFETKGGDSVTLRPEFTAGNVRSFISNGLQQKLPLKLFSTGPLFRYERPQKGRQRQFHQVNFEWLGDDSAQADAEIILLAARFLIYLGDIKTPYTLLINTLGDGQSRDAYRKALVDYLTPYESQLSEDSKRRLAKNPLRILDSKDPSDQNITQNAPKLTQYLSDMARTRFETVCALIKAQPEIQKYVKVEIAPSLVRGLDYYNHTVFEFVSDLGELGAQNTVLAGGRYDGLVEHMGGNPTPAIGFAAGVERLVLMLERPDMWQPSNDAKILLIPSEDFDKNVVLTFALQLRSNLRLNNASVEISWHGNIKKRMEKAGKAQVSHVILFSPEEAEKKQCAVKNMHSGEQTTYLTSQFSDADFVNRLFTIVR
jgi:histidyl-tRNA synthetase